MKKHCSLSSIKPGQKGNCKEESGIKDFELVGKSIFDVDVHLIPENTKKGEPPHYHFDIRFIFKTNCDKFIISDESIDLKWFTFDEFLQLDQTEERKRFAAKWKKLL